MLVLIIGVLASMVGILLASQSNDNVNGDNNGSDIVTEGDYITSYSSIPSHNPTKDPSASPSRGPSATETQRLW